MNSATSDRSNPLPVTANGKSAGEVARACSTAAANTLRTAFASERAVSHKGRGNVVTKYDVEVERMVEAMLREAFPKHGLLGEETAAETPAEGYVWVLDPIDGTRNFASGIPFFAFNLALTLDGEPVLGLTLDPVRGETFYAERGRGLLVNGVPARASDKKTVMESVVAIDVGFDDQVGKQQLGFAYRLYPGLQTLRVPGSAALGLAYAASGRYDCYSHGSLCPWDSAAGILLVAEGGGVVTNREGDAATIFDTAALAGGPAVQADFLRLWREYAETSDM